MDHFPWQGSFERLTNVTTQHFVAKARSNWNSISEKHMLGRFATWEKSQVSSGWQRWEAQPKAWKTCNMKRKIFFSLQIRCCLEIKKPKEIVHLGILQLGWCTIITSNKLRIGPLAEWTDTMICVVPARKIISNPSWHPKRSKHFFPVPNHSEPWESGFLQRKPTLLLMVQKSGLTAWYYHKTL